MIYMMGKYSDDLEEIIEERTSSLIEEKQKVDALLERMLPKPVARQLMKGSIPIKICLLWRLLIYYFTIVPLLFLRTSVLSSICSTWCK